MIRVRSWRGSNEALLGTIYLSLCIDYALFA